jgi:DNA-binding CsgD family transcriptional regulator
VAIRLRVPLVALWLAPDLARLAVADGQPDRADWIAGEIERVAPVAGTGTAHAVARFCRAVVSHDAEALLVAADEFEAAGRPLFAARALDAAGEAAARAGRRATAVDALRRAAGIYESVGAVLDGRATARELRSLGARAGARGARRRPVSGWSSLTPSEQTVAALVAEGLANGEIAARLYVSKRTVETHISRLYVKLQVDSRVAIAHIGREATEPASSEVFPSPEGLRAGRGHANPRMGG